ncbi:hypothetical protein WJ883_04780 [Coxiella burnetii]
MVVNIYLELNWGKKLTNWLRDWVKAVIPFLIAGAALNNRLILVNPI